MSMDATPISAAPDSLRDPLLFRRQLIYVAAFDALPLALAVVAFIFFTALRPRPYDLAVFGGMWLITALGVTVGFHRLFTHQAFQMRLRRKACPGLGREHVCAGSGHRLGGDASEASHR